MVALVGVPAFAWSKGSGLRGRAAGFFARLAGWEKLQERVRPALARCLESAKGALVRLVPGRALRRQEPTKRSYPVRTADGISAAMMRRGRGARGSPQTAPQTASKFLTKRAADRAAGLLDRREASPLAESPSTTAEVRCAEVSAEDRRRVKRLRADPDEQRSTVETILVARQALLALGVLVRVEGELLELTYHVEAEALELASVGPVRGGPRAAAPRPGEAAPAPLPGQTRPRELLARFGSEGSVRLCIRMTEVTNFVLAPSRTALRIEAPSMAELEGWKGIVVEFEDQREAIETTATLRVMRAQLAEWAAGT